MEYLQWFVGAAAVGSLVLAAVYRRDPRASAASRRLQALLQDPTRIASVWSHKKILVLLNPVGGGGRGYTVWTQLVRPVLDRADIAFTLVTTERRGDAHAILSSHHTGLHGFAGILVISGDGMLHEVVNGLYQRCGYDAAKLAALSRRLPLAIIPGGTMNGVSTSLAATNPHQALLNILNCRESQAVDSFLAGVQGHGPPLMDVHVASCCIVSDHDELLERQLRTLPTFMRTAIAPAVVIARANTYKAKLFINAVVVDPHERHLGVNDALETLPLCEPPPHEMIQRNAAAQRSSNWRLIDDEFILCCLINVKHAASDMIFAPAAQPNDGALHLLVVRSNRITRVGMMKIFLAMQNGSHVKNSALEYYKATDFVFWPDENQHGTLLLSGERAPAYGPIAASVQPRQLQFIF